MSYDLDAVFVQAVNLEPEALATRVSTLLGEGRSVTFDRGRFVCDGSGFTVEHGPRAWVLSATVGRSARDEHAMEWAAWVLSGPAGEVVDRHTGRRWPARLLHDWLSVTALFSGRALAVNEERIAHTRQPVAAREFADRVQRIAEHIALREDRGSLELRGRIREELMHYAARPAFVWTVARAMATLGDFSRLEALTRSPSLGAREDHGDADAFAVAAGYGEAALELFRRSLEDQDPNHRRAAARALHHVKHPGVFLLVQRALEDRRSTVREAVLEHGFEEIMAMPGAREAMARTLARLGGDPNTTVRRLVARWL